MGTKKEDDFRHPPFSSIYWYRLEIVAFGFLGLNGDFSFVTNFNLATFFVGFNFDGGFSLFSDCGFSSGSGFFHSGSFHNFYSFFNDRIGSSFFVGFVTASNEHTGGQSN